MSSLRPNDSWSTTTPGQGPPPTGGTARWAFRPPASVSAGMPPALTAFDGESCAAPGGHAAVDDVPDLAGSVPAQQRGADRRALARGADHRDGAVWVDPLGDVVQIVVGRPDRAGYPA